MEGGIVLQPDLIVGTSGGKTRKGEGNLEKGVRTWGNRTNGVSLGLPKGDVGKKNFSTEGLKQGGEKNKTTKQPVPGVILKKRFEKVGEREATKKKDDNKSGEKKGALPEKAFSANERLPAADRQ